MYVAETEVVHEGSAAGPTTAPEATEMTELPHESLVETRTEARDTTSGDWSGPTSDVATKAIIGIPKSKLEAINRADPRDNVGMVAVYEEEAVDYEGSASRDNKL